MPEVEERTFFCLVYQGPRDQIDVDGLHTRVQPTSKSLRSATMLSNLKSVLAAIVAVAIFGPIQAQAQVTGTCQPSVGEAYLDINEVRARIFNNGQLFWSGSPNVYEVPQGRGVNAIFATSIWLGGLVNDELRVAGTKYGPFEFWAGPLGDDGSAPTDCAPWDKIWKISKGDIDAYTRDGIATPDLLDWPTGLGAPTLNAQGEPIDLTDQPLASRIDRKIDLAAGERPDFIGDQMLWWIMNDKGNAHEFTKTPSIGAEIHGTAFAFNVVGALGYTTFYRYRIKNKGTSPLEKTFLGIFSDPDLGAAFDDYVGSDTTLGLGFAYNADNDDDENYGAAPPALGYDFLQGPLVNDNGIDDDRDGQIDEPDERLKMTSFANYYSSNCGVAGCYRENGTDIYNYLQGLWIDGKPITIGGNGFGFSNIETKFMYSGNPPAFWSELNVEEDRVSANSPADRRFNMSTGPFIIEPNGEQTIIFGIITSFGADNLDSVRQLKEDDAVVQQAFDEGFTNLVPYVNPSESEAATLIAPADASGNHPPGVLLHWEGSLGPIELHWRVQYADNPSLISPKDVSTEGNNVVLPLEINTSYWWRVAAVGPRNQVGPWSETWNLNTGEDNGATIQSFQVVANAAGPLNPPAMGAIAIGNNGFPLVGGADRPANGQQASNASLWGIHTGRSSSANQSGSWKTFVLRAMRNGWDDVFPYDFEVRFTESCHAAWKTSIESGITRQTNPIAEGCYAYDRFGDGWSLYSVPFEVWRIGINTPDDDSDDVRLIVVGLDWREDGWGIDHDDHPVSEGDDDPQTDWNYWYLPNDLTPGQSGYDSWLNGVISNYGSGNADWSVKHGPETFARIVFVSLDGGSVADRARPYGPLAMPEAGTVFRINTNKPVAPVLSAPRDGTVSAPASMRFYWTATPGVNTLEIYMVDGLIREIPNAGSGLIVENLPGGVLIWRVGSDEYGWSETWTVNVTALTGNETSDELPSVVELSPNYPNPFNPQTTIQFGLPAASSVQLEVFDSVGRRVKAVVEGQFYSPGRHTVTFDGSGLASGVYIYRLRAGNTLITRTMTLIK